MGLPLGLDRVDRVKPRAIKQVAIGPMRLGGDAVGLSPAQYLTGDRNLVNVQATVQYRIADPAAYLLVCQDVESLIASTGQAILTQRLAGDSVDHILTEGKQQVAAQAQDQLQHQVDRYGVGITIRSVDIVQVQPPPEVAESFADVISADRMREQRIHQARSYFDQTRELAIAEGQRVRDEASFLSRPDDSTCGGRGGAVLNDYWPSTNGRPSLHAGDSIWKTLAEALPKFRSKLIVDSGSDLDLSILREESP